MTLRIMRRLGAIAILAVGAVHLQQYLAGYRSVPTIGSLFLLNAVSAGVVAIGLLAPIERIGHHRRPELTSGLLAGAGMALAGGSLVALFVSETGTLFGFSETGYSTAIVLAMIAEALAVVLLAPVAVANLKRATSAGGGPGMTRPATSR